MKKMLYLFATMVFFTSCDNGLNKSILEPLTVDELKANMKKDTTFTDFYSEIQKIRKFVMESDVRQAKYADITYKRVYKYGKKLTDSTFINNLHDEQRELYDMQYPTYKSKVDSIITYWKTYKNKYSLDSLVTIKYEELWKEHYSYSNDVKSVNIGFKVTPLKGTIDQLVFRYCIKSKISNDGNMSVWDSHRCLASSPIYSTKTLYWEANYSDEKYLKNMSSTQVSRDYDFNIEIVEIRMNGENMSEKLEAIPTSVESALRWDKDGSISDYYKDEIIKELIDPNHITFYDFYMQALSEEQKKIDIDVYNMFKDLIDYNIND